MIRAARSYPPFTLAAAACALCVVILGWSVLGAARVSAKVHPRSATSETSEVSHDSARVAQTATGPAVNADPFRSDRRRPPRRFTLPGTGAAPIISARAPAVLLSGTVVYADGGGIALIKVQGRSAMVRVGETVEGLTLKSVAREQAVFARSGGGQLVLHVPKAGS